MSRLPDRPCVRPLQLVVDREAGVLLLHDPQGFTDSCALDLRLAPILFACDGTTPLAELPKVLEANFGQQWSVAAVEAVLEKLDQWLLLDSPRFTTVAAERLAAFRAAPVRPAVHAGVSYASEPDVLRKQLDAILAQASPPPHPADRLVGVVAPHIDLRVGQRAYAPAYRLVQQLAETLPADEPLTFVVFGTSHYGGDGLFLASRKDYATPLGTIGCDRDFLDRLEAQLGFSISADDTSHRQEHSIEFQAIFLRHLFDARAAGPYPVQIVPILCTSLHALYADDPAERERTRTEYETIIQALRTTLAKTPYRTVLLVGGDLAHVGPKFGDDFDAQTRAKALERADSELLAYVAAGDSRAVLEHIAQDADARRVCGFPPLMAYLDTLSAFGPTEGQVLYYEQWQEQPTRSAVTYGVAATWRTEA